MQKMGVGIVGYGFIGKVHALAHLSLPVMYDPMPVYTNLIGVCAPSKETRDKAVREAGFPIAVSNYHELLERDDIQIIHCCTPNDLHHAMVLDAIKAGKHVYCDKPLALDAAQAEEMAAASRDSSAVCRMTFNYRFVPAVMRAKELILSGFLGTVIQFRIAYLHSGYVDPERPFTWRMDKARSGGGAIMDLGTHAYDLLRYLIGDAEAIHASLRTIVTERHDRMSGKMRNVDVDDLAIVQLEMGSGAVGVLEVSRMATGKQDELRFEIHGDKGAIEFNLMDPNWLAAYENRSPETALGGQKGPQSIECMSRYPAPYSLGVTKNSVGWIQFHIHCLYSFLSAIAGGADDCATFDDGLAAQMFVAACQQSAKDKVWVEL
jgi:predicted dehydrogenase